MIAKEKKKTFFAAQMFQKLPFAWQDFNFYGGHKGLKFFSFISSKKKFYAVLFLFIQKQRNKLN